MIEAVRVACQLAGYRSADDGESGSAAPLAKTTAAVESQPR